MIVGHQAFFNPLSESLVVGQFLIESGSRDPAQERLLKPAREPILVGQCIDFFLEEVEQFKVFHEFIFWTFGKQEWQKA